jgi:hypothetical protein
MASTRWNRASFCEPGGFGSHSEPDRAGSSRIYSVK